MKKIYLASPYSHPDDTIKIHRFKRIAEVVASLMRKDGKSLFFSPIAFSHPVALYGNMDGSWVSWKKIDIEFINFCEELWVVMLDGWKESTGVKEELRYALDQNKTVRFYQPDLDTFIEYDEYEQWM